MGGVSVCVCVGVYLFVCGGCIYLSVGGVSVCVCDFNVSIPEFSTSLATSSLCVCGCICV